MRLSSVLNVKHVISIKRLLHERLANQVPIRSLTKLHASALTYAAHEFCPREYALSDLTHKNQGKEFIGTSQQYTFDLGNAIQDKFNNDWLVDRMVGDWECTSCNSKECGAKKPKGHCDKNGINCSWRFIEPRFKSVHCGASAGIDALIDVGRSKLIVVECKTMDKDMFKKLEAPLSEHRIRTNLYLRLIAESNHPLRDKIETKFGIVLYMAKAFGFKDTELKSKFNLKDAAFSPFKDFTVKRDDAQTDHYVAKAKAVHDFREKVSGIPTGICPNSLCKRAQNCRFITECFSGSYPHQNKWK